MLACRCPVHCLAERCCETSSARAVFDESTFGFVQLCSLPENESAVRAMPAPSSLQNDRNSSTICARSVSVRCVAMPTSSSTIAGRFHFSGICGSAAQTVGSPVSSAAVMCHADASMGAAVRVPGGHEVSAARCAHLQADEVCDTLVQRARAPRRVQVHHDVACRTPHPHYSDWMAAIPQKAHQRITHADAGSKYKGGNQRRHQGAGRCGSGCQPASSAAWRRCPARPDPHCVAPQDPSPRI